MKWWERDKSGIIASDAALIRNHVWRKSMFV